MSKLAYKDNADGSRTVTDNGRDIGRVLPTISVDGLQDWSRTLADVIIFSVYRDTTTERANRVAHNSACEHLAARNVPHAVGEGCYKGTREQCIIVRCDTPADEDTARILAVLHNQESVLHLNASRLARLETPSGEVLEYLGALKVVSRETAKLRDAYTKANGCYYITEN